MPFTIEIEREMDGRWIAEIPELPGVMVYGATERKAVVNVLSLAIRVLEDQEDAEELTQARLEDDEIIPWEQVKSEYLAEHSEDL